MQALVVGSWQLAVGSWQFRSIMSPVKAILVRTFGGPEVLQPAAVDDPVVTPGRVVVRIQAAGVNPVDAYIRTGSYARLPSLPWIPGFDGAGIVESVGASVTRFHSGDCVYVTTLGSWNGTYAERTLCDVEHLHPLPPNVSFPQGAAIGVPAATAYRALFGRAHARRGETVLVHGASGAVGLAAVQFAKGAGLTVLGTAGTDEGLALVQRMGAAHVFDHRDDGRGDLIKAATDGRGVDVIIEMLASANLDRDLGLLAPRGRVVIVGSRGRIEIDPRQTMGKDLSVFGMTLWNVTAEELTQIHERIGEALREGTLTPVVGREFPLEDAAEAHRTLLGSSALGKMVLAV
jgi:NADPH2:quinone reductase